jgi:predicted metal-dependent hydrolase
VRETAPPEPVLSADEAEAFRKGVEQFNEGLYFECHDTLEDLWSGIRGPARDFFQGLIQVAVAYYHLTGGNATGAESMILRALKRFEPYPERYFGFDLGAQRAELSRRLSNIASGVDGVSVKPPPSWQFD